MSTYQSVLERIVSRGKPVASKRVGNNTYAELRIVGDNSTTPATPEQHGFTPLEQRGVAIRLHQTDVVLYTGDGTCVLNTGGWRTVTTKDRINAWAPMGVSVYSVKGEWRVFYGRQRETVPFADGITLKLTDEVAPYFRPVEGTYPSPTREEELKAAKKKLDADIKAFVAKLPEKAAAWARELKESGRLNTAGDCFYCQGLVTTPDGAQVMGKDHLWSHLREGYLFPSLVLAAIAARGYRDPRFIFVNDLTYRDAGNLVEHVKKYLRKQLEPGTEPAGDVISAAARQWFVDQAVQVLEKPSDFVYFGGDETLWNTSAPTWTKHRDSENHDIANFEVVWNALAAEFPELVPDDLDDEHYPPRDFNPAVPGAIYVFGARHWAVGHIDQIVVPVKLDATRPVDVDNLHPAFIRVCEFGRQVRDYPVLPGAEEIVDRLDAEDRAREARSYLDGEPTDEQVNQLVVAVLNDQSGEWPGYLEDGEWHRIITGAGLAPASWVTPAEGVNA